MAKSVMILGMGRFGASVAHTLFQMGYDVLGIDTDEAFSFFGRRPLNGFIKCIKILIH